MLVVVVVVDVGGAAGVVVAAGRGTFATIRVNLVEVDKAINVIARGGAEVGGNGCSPTRVALTLILAPITITLTVNLTLIRACHSTKFPVRIYVGAVGWG